MLFFRVTLFLCCLHKPGLRRVETGLGQADDHHGRKGATSSSTSAASHWVTMQSESWRPSNLRWPWMMWRWPCGASRERTGCRNGSHADCLRHPCVIANICNPKSCAFLIPFHFLCANARFFLSFEFFTNYLIWNLTMAFSGLLSNLHKSRRQLNIVVTTAAKTDGFDII